MSTSTLTKWGSSAGVVIPKTLREDLGLSIGDKLDIRKEGNTIVIEPVSEQWTLHNLMEDYKGSTPEFIDPGESFGREIW